jgi:NAD-dependent SIR2 family protein deacetylase
MEKLKKFNDMFDRDILQLCLDDILTAIFVGVFDVRKFVTNFVDSIINLNKFRAQVAKTKISSGVELRAHHVAVLLLQEHSRGGSGFLNTDGVDVICNCEFKVIVSAISQYLEFGNMFEYIKIDTNDWAVALKAGNVLSKGDELEYATCHAPLSVQTHPLCLIELKNKELGFVIGPLRFLNHSCKEGNVTMSKGKFVVTQPISGLQEVEFVYSKDEYYDKCICSNCKHNRMTDADVVFDGKLPNERQPILPRVLTAAGISCVVESNEMFKSAFYFSGAGVSVSAGISTYAETSKNFFDYDTATAAANKPTLQKFISKCILANPTHFHHYVKEHEKYILYITQNVDGLDAKVGMSTHFPIHGEVRRLACSAIACKNESFLLADSSIESELFKDCPEKRRKSTSRNKMVSCPGKLIPRVVYVGPCVEFNNKTETYHPQMFDSSKNSCAVFIGTSGERPGPVNLFNEVAKANGTVIYSNVTFQPPKSLKFTDLLLGDTQQYFYILRCRDSVRKGKSQFLMDLNSVNITLDWCGQYLNWQRRLLELFRARSTAPQ